MATSTVTSTSTLPGSKKKNPAHIAWWIKNFKDKESVSNKVFATAVQKHLEKKGKKAGSPVIDGDLSIFSKNMSKFIFWPVGEVKEGELYPDKVDIDSLQFALDTWGLWSKMFQTIHQNLEISSPKPLEFFYGRMPKAKTDKKLKKVGDFLLRYDTDDEKKKQKKGGLILSWAKQGKGQPIVVKDEYIRRAKIGGNYVWVWSKKEATTSGCKIVRVNFTNLHEFLEASKKDSRGVNPVMLTGAYACYKGDGEGEDDEKKQQAEAKVGEIVAGVDLTAVEGKER